MQRQRLSRSDDDIFNILIFMMWRGRGHKHHVLDFLCRGLSRTTQGLQAAMWARPRRAGERKSSSWKEQVRYHPHRDPTTYVVYVFLQWLFKLRLVRLFERAHGMTTSRRATTIAPKCPRPRCQNVLCHPDLKGMVTSQETSQGLVLCTQHQGWSRTFRWAPMGMRMKKA